MFQPERRLGFLAGALIGSVPALARPGAAIGPIAAPDPPASCGCRFRTAAHAQTHSSREEVLLCPGVGAAGTAQMNLIGADRRLRVLESRQLGRPAVGTRWSARFGGADGGLTVRLDATIRALRPDDPAFRAYRGTLTVLRGTEVLGREEVVGVCGC
jgi:hypothetical protein